MNEYTYHPKSIPTFPTKDLRRNGYILYIIFTCEMKISIIMDKGDQRPTIHDQLNTRSRHKFNTIKIFGTERSDFN